MTFLVPGVARADFMITAEGYGYYAFETEDMSEHADLSGVNYTIIAQRLTEIINAAASETPHGVTGNLQGAIWNDDCKIAWNDLDDSTVNNIIDILAREIEGFDFLRGFMS